ncbi:hypothetical protein JTB14_016006 [Gonioctena quinquepunctata]|nr:hypothetical protein JTB14_016006 [Gonioctena quinquepunctata]
MDLIDFSFNDVFKTMYADQIGQTHFKMDFLVWIDAYCSKIVGISRGVAQNLPRIRAEAGTKDVMEDMFEKLESVIRRLNLQDKPQNVFKTDKIGFQTHAGVQKKSTLQRWKS